MSVLSSLTNRIFLASALLAVVSIGVALVSVNVAVTRHAEGELSRGLDDADTALEEYRQALFDHFSREARLVADLPRLKAAVSSLDPPTVRPIAEEYQQQVDADLFIVTDATGRLLARAGPASGLPLDTLPGVAPALRGSESRSFVSHDGGILHVASVPVWIDPQQPEILGSLSVGLNLDARTASQFRALTNSQIAFGMHGRVYVSTLPRAAWPALTPLFAATGMTRTVSIDGEDFIAITRPLAAGGTGDTSAGVAEAGAAPIAVILRSRTERLRLLGTVHRALGLTAVVAVLLATLLSYAIARSVTRPLGAVTAVMREMAATGDLTRRLPPVARSRWEDEDARLLASTFSAMTESIARFQRDAAQKERLSSLGRLSTVVAHEIRNPLMIIKAALRGLRPGGAGPDQVQHAVSDIDEEVARLDRLVSEVLDFARPIHYEYEPVDINALCREAARALAPVTGDAPPITWRLADGLSELITDRERVRLALVNILDNARQAIAGQHDGHGRGSISIGTAASDDGGATITVADDGPGIAPDDLPRVFEPYFTTRRTGTGLGLAISRNVIEGLGGTIVVTTTAGAGTTVRIGLPPGPPSET